MAAPAVLHSLLWPQTVLHSPHRFRVELHSPPCCRMALDGCEAATVEVCVASLQGGPAPVTVHCAVNEYIANILAPVLGKLGIPAEQHGLYRMIFSNQQLMGCRTLTDYNIQTNRTVHLGLRYVGMDFEPQPTKTDSWVLRRSPPCLKEPAAPPPPPGSPTQPPPPTGSAPVGADAPPLAPPTPPPSPSLQLQVAGVAGPGQLVVTHSFMWRPIC